MSSAAPTGDDYFANHARARQFPWTLYHQPLERDLAAFLREVSVEHPTGEVLVVGCGLLHEIDAAPAGLRFHVTDIEARAVATAHGVTMHRAAAVNDHPAFIAMLADLVRSAA